MSALDVFSVLGLLGSTMGSFISSWIALVTVLLSDIADSRHVASLMSRLNRQGASGRNGSQWTYNGVYGPPLWPVVSPQCAGLEQSPVNIDTASAILDAVNLKPFVFSSYQKPCRNNKMKNMGKTVQIYFNPGTWAVSGGGLPGNYALYKMHFHWGADDSRGSEHTVNGRSFPMEMHVIHYNKKYRNFKNAAGKRDGLAVLGFMFQVGRYNPYLQNITDYFYTVPLPNYEGLVPELVMSQLLPSRLERFWRYNGSLTTPPCGETVLWSVFADPIQISEHQLQLFRTALFTSNNEPLTDNYRDIQPLNGRQIYASHPSISAQSARVLSRSRSRARPRARPRPLAIRPITYNTGRRMDLLDEFLAMFS